MKKVLAVALAAILAVTAFGAGFGAAAANRNAAKSTIQSYVADSAKLTTAQKFKYGLANVINKLSNFLLNDAIINTVTLLVRDADSVEKLKDFDLDDYANFFEGTEDWIGAPLSNARWNVGYDKESIVPDDFGKEKKYCRGSYVPYNWTTEIYKDEDGVTEDLCVRTVAISDGTDRGIATYSVIDCIGLSNTDVRRIRNAVGAFAAEKNIVSMNVGASHTHTGIDTQGAWNHPLKAAANNIFTHRDVISGVDPDFLAKLIESAKNSIIAAVDNMTPGTLEYSRFDGSAYIHDRTVPLVCDPDIYSLKFIPDSVTDASRDGTYICSFGTHPEITSYAYPNDNGELSADIVYYMDKVMDKAGYNFIYIQGNVGTNSTGRSNSNDNGLDRTEHEAAMRFGYEIGYILLGLDKTEDECAEINAATGDLLGVEEYAETHEGYSVWYEQDLSTKEHKTVAPYLNVKSVQTKFTLENKVSLLLTKTGIASNKIVKDGLRYYMLTEVGLVGFGDAFTAIMNPGELYSELLMPGCEELGSVNGGFKYNAIREDYGDDIVMFDLMNDACGYLEPDNYYVLAGMQYDKNNDSFDGETWCLLVSPGKTAASEIVGVYHELLDSVN